ncbi:hypothetical protein STAN_7023 [Streptomyces sp. CBMAI 2042]|nr:hypothetical protein STAN_7023 [Streptomyces sp. CBMAI 2042]
MRVRRGAAVSRPPGGHRPMLRHMPARPEETTPCAERQTDRIPPPVGTRALGTLGAHRFVLRGGAAGA